MRKAKVPTSPACSQPRSSSIQIDTPATVVTSVVASLASGAEQPGDTVTFTITMNRAVTVTGGTPTLTLNDGGIAVYDAAASAALGDPTKMVFSYTIGVSDLPADGLSFVRGDQNGAVIVDAAGRGPDFSGVFNTAFSEVHIEPTLPGVQTVGAVFQVADGLAHEMGSMTTAELASGNFAAAWVIDGTLHTQIFDLSGARLGSELDRADVDGDTSTFVHGTGALDDISSFHFRSWRTAALSWLWISGPPPARSRRIFLMRMELRSASSSPAAVRT